MPVLRQCVQGGTFEGGNMALAQVGWIGQTGEVYALHDPPMDSREPGSFSPLYMQVGVYRRDEETGRPYLDD